jgi:hypothetical protein
MPRWRGKDVTPAGQVVMGGDQDFALDARPVVGSIIEHPHRGGRLLVQILSIDRQTFTFTFRQVRS